MNELTTWSFEGSEIRTVDLNGEPWWVLKDVCTVLELTTPAKVAERLEDDEKGMSLIHTLGGEQNMTIINESGLYSVILRSDKPQAKPFRKWVTSEVLPTIRKTGGYTINDDSQNIQLRKLEVQEQNAKTRMAALLMKMTAVDTLSTEYKNILTAKAAEVLTGVPVLPPVKSEKTYSAGEIGQMFGVSAQKIGRIANEIGLKTDEFGAWYRDKSQHSAKEVDVFRYNEKAVERFKALLSSDDGEEST